MRMDVRVSVRGLVLGRHKVLLTKDDASEHSARRVALHLRQFPSDLFNFVTRSVLTTSLNKSLRRFTTSFNFESNLCRSLFTTN